MRIGSEEPLQAQASSSDAAIRLLTADQSFTHFPRLTVSGHSTGKLMLDWSDRSPDATFDLHGQSVSEAVANAEHFLKAQAKARPGGTVRLITGRGRSGGGAPIRTRIRGLLRRLKESASVVRDYVLEETEGSYLVRLVG